MSDTSFSATPAAQGIGLNLLFRSLDAVRQWRPMVPLVLFGVQSVFLLAVFSLAGNPLVFLLGATIAGLVFFVGYNAAGVGYMAVARGLPQPTLVEGVRSGFAASLRFLGILAATWVAFLLVWIVELAVFFTGNIPLLGSILFAFTYPVVVVINAVLLLGAYIFLALLAPAVWDGQGIGRTVAHLLSIARRRPIQVFVLLLLLLLLAAVIGFSIGVLAGAADGIALTTASLAMHQPLENPALPAFWMFMDGGTDAAMMEGYLGNPGPYGGVSAQFFGLVFGQMLVLGIVALLPIAVSMLGWCYIYLGALEEVDPGEMEVIQARLRERWGRVRPGAGLPPGAPPQTPSEP